MGRGQGRLFLAFISLMANEPAPRAPQESDRRSGGKAAQHARYPPGAGDSEECNLRGSARGLKTPAGSSRTRWPDTESRKGCLRKMAWQRCARGRSGLIFSCGQHRKGLLFGGGRGNRESEIRSPDVYLYIDFKSFGNKLEKKRCATKSEMHGGSPRVLGTEVVLRDLKQI